MMRRRSTRTGLVLLATAIITVGIQLGAARPDQHRSLVSTAFVGGDLLDHAGLVLPQRTPGTVAPVPAASLAAPASPRPPRSAERVIAPAPATFVGKPAPRQAPPPALRQPAPSSPGATTWAVIIGINDYPGSGSDLRSAVNDANDMSEALWRMGVPGDHRMVIRDGQASAGVIRASLDWLARTAGPESTAVFFYAGHVRKGGGHESLVGSDGGTVSDSEVAQRLAPMKSQRAWIAIAACYGGGFTEVLRPGRILTGAADANHLAYENSGFGRSYMVQYMIREAMIQGRASSPTVEAAFAYAQAAIQRDYPNRQPVQFDQFQGLLDLRPAGAGTPNYTQPQPQSQPQPQAPSSQPPSGPAPGEDAGQDPGKSGSSNQNCTTLLGVQRCNDDE
ncbi:MAG TPA: caspase family protein [Acidimicrobiales bacterium]|nr:caspase family protein [Acidimicrobiales bacterium]